MLCPDKLAALCRKQSGTAKSFVSVDVKAFLFSGIFSGWRPPAA